MLRFDRRQLLLVGLVASLHSSLLSAPLHAADGDRQYYGDWSFSVGLNYWFANLFFKVTATATAYDYHYAIWFEATPGYIFYFNPITKRFWGRYDLASKDPAKVYSLLKEEDRKEKLSEIPESAFPAPAALPKIPEVEDDLVMAKPPAPPKGKAK